MARSIHATTAAQLVVSNLFPIWLIRLDIANDPVYIHTGLGPLAFAAAATGDSALDTYTFNGVGNVGQMSAISDGPDGSQSVTLRLPGIELAQDYLHQIITNADIWQGRQAWIWLALVDTSTMTLYGNPIRVKTGRMDKMPITLDPDSGTGALELTIESQQAYSGIALFTRYVEQAEIDPTDTSQKFIAALANHQPTIGQSGSANVVNGGGGGGLASIGDIVGINRL